MLAEVAVGQGAEVIVATHNQVCTPACNACSSASTCEQSWPVLKACAGAVDDNSMSRLFGAVEASAA